MNFSSILALVVQALTVREASFAITVGAQHYLVTINENSKPSGMNWLAVFQVVGLVLSGSTGTFTAGVFGITIQPLVTSVGTPPASKVLA